MNVICNWNTHKLLCKEKHLKNAGFAKWAICNCLYRSKQTCFNCHMNIFNRISLETCPIKNTQSTHTLHITDISGTLCKFEESGAGVISKCTSFHEVLHHLDYWSYKLKETHLRITPDLTDFTYLKSQFTWKILPYILPNSYSAFIRETETMMFWKLLMLFL